MEFRSKTLKKQKIDGLDFEYINLPSMSKLERLERLELKDFRGFIPHQYDKGAFHLQEFLLW